MQVSIIIPVYNSEEFILDCLNSVINQTFPKQKMEVIVINDGSTDKTSKVLDGFAYRKNWKIISQENQGPAAARTRGLKEAKGEYVFILSHDCIAAPDWVESVVAEFEKDEQVAIVQGKILPEKEIDTPIFHCTRLEQFSPHFETAAIAYSAKALDKAGRYFDKELSEFGDDTDLAWRILEQGYTSKWLNAPLAHHKVLPQPFFKEIKKAWGCQKFPLLVKKHSGLRKYLKFGFVWNGLGRLGRVGLILAWLIWPKFNNLTITLLFVTTYYILYVVLQVFKQTSAWKISSLQKLFIVLPHSFLTNIVATLALLLGSLRHRTLVI